MGNIWSYFAKKKTSLEELQDIDDIINNIDEYQINVQKRRKVTQTLVFYAGALLILTGCCYLYFFPKRAFRESWITWAILIALFILLIFLKQILCWYFEHQLQKNRQKRNNAITKKDKIIKNVMETETYNTAKTILEKYAPQLRPQLLTQPLAAGRQMQPGNVLIKRSSAPSSQQISVINQSGQQLGPLPARQLESLSIVNRVIEFIIGDGPSNRYALICTNCHSHNGLVLPEEFPYISFRCHKCSSFHAARKLRPSAPKLPDQADISAILTELEDEKTETAEKESNAETDIAESADEVADVPSEPIDKPLD